MVTLVLLSLLWPSPGRATGPTTYQQLTQAISLEQRQQRRRCRGRRCRQGVYQLVLSRVDQLHQAWQGSRWGLGPPQSSHPRAGKINCGFFVGLVLRHAGLNLPVYKFNRQAARDAIRSLAPRRRIRYFHRAPMSRFIADVRRMGPGLYLIGLDFHIGFLRLRRPDDVLRFVHASYVTKTVIDEPAKEAIPIVRSRYRMVGKLLGPRMLEAWLSGRRIKVLGPR